MRNIVNNFYNVATEHREKKITIYAPMIYTALCVMFLMQADTLRGQVGGGWVLEMESFLGPVKWHRRVPFGAQKTQDFQGPTPSHLPTQCICPYQKHYAQGHINHRCIGGLMYRSPPWRGLRVQPIILRVHTTIPTCAYTYVARDRPRR